MRRAIEDLLFVVAMLLWIIASVVVIAFLLTQPATSRVASTPRPAVVTPLAIGIGAMGTPTADRAADPPAAQPSPAVVASKARRPSAEPAPLGSDPRAGGRPALPTPGTHSQTLRVSPKPTTRPSERVRGTATWYRYVDGQAAAGPRLRAALGAGWRGTTVLVCGLSTCTDVLLSDFMGTKDRDKVIDLDDDTFRAVCGPLSMGVCDVEIRW